MGLPLLRPVYALYERMLEREVQRFPLPKHIAIIMDGNRRFGTEVGLGLKGHEYGAKKLHKVLEWCWDLGVKVVTVYGFSTENFKRPTEEVEGLMDLFEKEFARYTRDSRVHRKKVRLQAIGQVDKLPERVQKAIHVAQEATKDYDNHVFNVAIGYGGRQEVLDAIHNICERVKKGEIDLDQVDENLVSSSLYTSGLPDPDLIIRTSGEERLSGFLIWQCAYSELYFCDSYWPMFRRIDLLRAIRTYQQRQRRFGK